MFTVFCNRSPNPANQRLWLINPVAVSRYDSGDSGRGRFRQQDEQTPGPGQGQPRPGTDTWQRRGHRPAGTSLLQRHRDGGTAGEPWRGRPVPLPVPVPGLLPAGRRAEGLTQNEPPPPGATPPPRSCQETRCGFFSPLGTGPCQTCRRAPAAGKPRARPGPAPRPRYSRPAGGGPRAAAPAGRSAP